MTNRFDKYPWNVLYFNESTKKKKERDVYKKKKKKKKIKTHQSDDEEEPYTVHHHQQQHQQEYSEPNKYDIMFEQMLADCQPFIEYFSKIEQTRIKKWIKKLSQPMKYTAHKRNRNVYTYIMYQMLNKGDLGPPFHLGPAKGNLPTVPHDILQKLDIPFNMSYMPETSKMIENYTNKRSTSVKRNRTYHHRRGSASSSPSSPAMHPHYQLAASFKNASMLVPDAKSSHYHITYENQRPVSAVLVRGEEDHAIQDETSVDDPPKTIALERTLSDNPTSPSASPKKRVKPLHSLLYPNHKDLINQSLHSPNRLSSPPSQQQQHPNAKEAIERAASIIKHHDQQSTTMHGSSDLHLSAIPPRSMGESAFVEQIEMQYDVEKKKRETLEAMVLRLQQELLDAKTTIESLQQRQDRHEAATLDWVRQSHDDDKHFLNFIQSMDMDTSSSAS